MFAPHFKISSVINFRGKKKRQNFSLIKDIPISLVSPYTYSVTLTENMSVIGKQNYQY